MRVYVQSKDGQPLMPCSPGKARKLLSDGKAKVVRRTPFTIRLLFGSSGYKQKVTLGVDTGSKTIGLSATTEKEELYAAEVTLRNDIVKLLADRRQARRTRRGRLRYRKPRFLNRVKSKHKGWLAPSVEQKIDTHVRVVEDVCKILPIEKIVVEVASFDVQKLKADLEGLARPKGEDYQQGEQHGFWNAREYVLFRDGHTCRCCKGKSMDPVLEVHHIESRKTGGDAPNNLVTLCETCHTGYHAGKVKLPESIKRGNSFRDAAFMGVMRRAFYGKLKEIHPNVRMTYGYLTKNARIEAKLEKGHAVDARVISGNPLAKPLGHCFFRKKVRRHNRQIHKENILKGGRPKSNQAPYLVHGFRLFDKVAYDGIECFVTGRRSTGYFVLKTFNGKKIHDSAKAKDIKLISKAGAFITTAFAI